MQIPEITAISYACSATWGQVVLYGLRFNSLFSHGLYVSDTGHRTARRLSQMFALDANLAPLALAASGGTRLLRSCFRTALTPLYETLLAFCKLFICKALLVNEILPRKF